MPTPPELQEQIAALTGVRRRTARGIAVPFQSFADAEAWSAEGDTQSARLEYGRWSYLAKHLTEIRDADQVLLNSLRQKFRRAENNLDQFDGVRTEAYVAASLIRKKIEFVYQDAPDFLVPGFSNVVEVSSCRLDRAKQHGEVYYKVAAKLAEKAKKPYAGEHCILVLDITALAHGGSRFRTDELKKYFADHVADQRFGAIVALQTITTGVDTAEERIETGYLRLGEVSPPSHALLEAWFPRLARAPIIQYAAFRSG